MNAPAIKPASMFQQIGGEEPLRRLVNAFYDIVETHPDGEPVHKLHLEGFGVAHLREAQFEFLCGFLGVNSATLRETAVQRHLPDEMRARVSSLLSVAVTAGVLLVQVLAGALGEVLPYRAVSVLLALCGLLGVFAFVVRRRAAIRSTGISFDPSGTQILLTAGLPRAAPMAAAISRERRPCSIQKSRMPLSGCDSVRLSSALAWAKKVGLKSSPSP